MRQANEFFRACSPLEVADKMQAVSSLVLRSGILQVNECLVHAAVVNPHTLNWRGILVFIVSFFLSYVVVSHELQIRIHLGEQVRVNLNRFEFEIWHINAEYCLDSVPG
jgi:hypothetical protein